MEPFGGAAGILLRKPLSYAEVYNDIDGEVVNFFQVLRDSHDRCKLIELVRYTPFARAEFEMAYKANGDPVERARRFLIRSNMGFGSAAATKKNTGFRCASIKHLNRQNPSRNEQTLWATVPDNLRYVADRFKNVLIENKDALNVISHYDREQTLFYLDPPYLLDIRSMGNRNGCYNYEMSEEEHRKLLVKIKSLKAMVIISSYTNELYDRELIDWRKIERQCAAGGKSGSVIRHECLWLNSAVDKNKAQQSLFKHNIK